MGTTYISAPKLKIDKPIPFKLYERNVEHFLLPAAAYHELAIQYRQQGDFDGAFFYEEIAHSIHTKSFFVEFRGIGRL